MQAQTKEQLDARKALDESFAESVREKAALHNELEELRGVNEQLTADIAQLRARPEIPSPDELGEATSNDDTTEVDDDLASLASSIHDDFAEIKTDAKTAEQDGGGENNSAAKSENETEKNAGIELESMKWFKANQESQLPGANRHSKPASPETPPPASADIGDKDYDVAPETVAEYMEQLLARNNIPSGKPVVRLPGSERESSSEENVAADSQEPVIRREKTRPEQISIESSPAVDEDESSEPRDKVEQLPRQRATGN